MLTFKTIFIMENENESALLVIINIFIMWLLYFHFNIK